MSDKPTPEETALWQRRLASQANNRAWTLSESLSRTVEEDEEMLQAAHAAMYFWKIVGNDNHRAHAAQLLAHAYALLGLAHPASRYLAKSQPVFLSGGAEDWEVALAHAVASSVAAATKDADAHREHYDKAVALIEALPDPEDKKILSATLRVLPGPGAKVQFHFGRLIDHVHLRVSDLEASKRFYRTVIDSLDLGVTFVEAADHFHVDELFVDTASGPVSHVHLAFQTHDRAAVHKFHAAAIAAGGRDNGGPGERGYHPGYYAAFVLDPDGNNIEAVHHGPATRSAPSVVVTPAE